MTRVHLKARTRTALWLRFALLALGLVEGFGPFAARDDGHSRTCAEFLEGWSWTWLMGGFGSGAGGSLIKVGIGNADADGRQYLRRGNEL